MAQIYACTMAQQTRGLDCKRKTLHWGKRFIILRQFENSIWGLRKFIHATKRREASVH